MTVNGKMIGGTLEGIFSGLAIESLDKLLVKEYLDYLFRLEPE
jgi:hypothetical protein